MAPITKSSFISHTRGWEDAKQHECMSWMIKFTHAFNDPKVFDHKEDLRKWYTSNAIYTNSDGTTYKGFDNLFEGCKQIYAPFSQYLHEPTFVNCWETDNGWEMVGQATMFADLVAPGGDKKHEDLTGKKWDLGLPSMFHFWYVKDADGHDGIKMERCDVFADTFPAVQEMMKRGMIKA